MADAAPDEAAAAPARRAAAVAAAARAEELARRRRAAARADAEAHATPEAAAAQLARGEAAFNAEPAALDVMQEHRRTLTALLAALRLEPDEQARRAEAGVADAVWDQPQAAPGRFAVPADITELLRGLQLSQHGAALVDRLGVRSVADLSHVTDAVLHDALPELQSMGRDALIAAVEMAMWAAGVAAAPRAVAEAEEAQPDDAAPHAGNAQPDEPAWLAEWRLMEQGNGAAPAEAVAAPAPVAADAPLGAATSADPCVSCRRDRRLAVNTPCGHAFMCRACTDGFRGDNGPICNRCRQPSTVSDTAQSLTCCICSEEVTRTREMFYFRPCGHMTCVGCAVQLVRAALGDADGKFPFRCEPCRIEALEQRTQPPAPVPVDDLLSRLPASNRGGSSRRGSSERRGGGTLSAIQRRVARARQPVRLLPGARVRRALAGRAGRCHASARCWRRAEAMRCLQRHVLLGMQRDAVACRRLMRGARCDATRRRCCHRCFDPENDAAVPGLRPARDALPRPRVPPHQPGPRLPAVRDPLVLSMRWGDTDASLPKMRRPHLLRRHLHLP